MKEKSTILDVYEKRQEFIRDKTYKASKIILGISLLLMTITFFVQLFKDPTPLDKLTIFTHAELSFSYIATTVLTVLFNYIIWVFSVATFVFSPLIISIIYQGSKEYSIKGGKGIKLLQVASSLFLPAFLFAILWMNYGIEKTTIAMVPTVGDIAIIIVGSIVVSLVLWITTEFIPLKFAEVRLTVISSLLYSALFFMYSMGYSIIAMSILVGIIVFLIFKTKEIEMLANVLILYDLELEVANNIIESSSRRKQQDASQEELAVKVIDLQLERDYIDHAANEQQVYNDKRLAEQISAIQTEKLNLNEMANQAKLKYLQKKYEAINEMYSILEQERSDKIETEIPKKIKILREEAKNYTPEQLSQKMDALIGEMNFGGDYMPRALKKLQNEMDELSNQIASNPSLIENKRKHQAGEGIIDAKFNDVEILDNIIHDDLTRLLGIGPKISSILNNNNIFTYDQLALRNIDDIVEILKLQGSVFNLSLARTWGQQADLANKGLWNELKILQASLKLN